MSPAARLCGFVLLMGVLFAVAYAAGARLGPVTTVHAPPGPMPQMQMGSPAGQR
jgi:hypothetical protein